MRVFGSIVFAQPLLMRAVQSQTPERRSVRAQLVGDQQFGCEALLLEQLTHQPQRRPSVASALDQHVEDLALVVHGPPESIREPIKNSTATAMRKARTGLNRAVAAIDHVAQAGRLHGCRLPTLTSAL